MIKLKKIWDIAGEVSKKFGMVNSKTGEPLVKVTKINDNKVEIRTELTSYDGGEEMSAKLQAAYPGWICENQGGCVYILYKPL